MQLQLRTPADKWQERAGHQHELAGQARLSGSWILLRLLQRLGGHHPVSDAITPDESLFTLIAKHSVGTVCQYHRQPPANDKETLPC